MNELIYKSATSLAQMIRDKQVSSEEAVKAFLSRIEEVNPKLNAVVQFAADRALTEADQADQALSKGEVKGPLHGVPITIKDSIDTEGIITTGGTKGRSTFIPERDATIVTRLRDAGAIILGKTNTPELTLSFKTDNEVYGRTNNPYDLSRTSGGSSGGAAAIIASGGSPLDIGSDTGGSIRVPSHCCGITGIRPTSGRVPRTGHIIPYGLGTLDSFTTLGPLARFVEDLILCLPIISGPDWKDPAIVPMPLGDPSTVNLKNLKVAFFTDNEIATPTPETIQAVKTTAQALSDSGITVEEHCPEIMTESFNLFREVWSAYSRSWKEKLLHKAGTINKPDLPEIYRTYPMLELADLSEKLENFRSTMLSFIQKYDAIICPVNAYPAMLHDEDNSEAYSYTMTYNLTGWPVTVIRAGTSPEGLPIGIQIVARPWHEHITLSIAQHLEPKLISWQKPPI